MIIDTFMFNDEFDMLDIRLNLSKNYVDKWIILEGNKTWSGNKKPYHLLDNFKRYEEFKDRIELINLEIPEGYKDWVCENYSRKNLQIGIDKYQDNDIIIHSDLDEILNPNKVDEILFTLERENKPISCILEMYIYKFNQKLERTWTGHVIAKKRMIENPQILYKGKNHKRKDRSHTLIFPEIAGWHWTWMGDDERIKNKVKSCIESQYKDPEEVLQALKNSQPNLAINHKCFTNAVENQYPDDILKVISKYPWW